MTLPVRVSQAFGPSAECFIKGPCSLVHKILRLGYPEAGPETDSGACDFLKEHSLGKVDKRVKKKG